jgi:DNA-binding transcriptional MocR family regulator
MAKKNPLYQQIIDDYILKIERGDLLPGASLPPERTLAKQWGVNRSTVVRALEELTSLGWIIRKQGSGTQVAQSQLANRRTPFSHWSTFPSHSRLKDDPYLKKMRERQKTIDDIDLFTGELPTELIPNFSFPAMAWDQILKKATENTSSGYTPLLHLLKDHLQRTLHFSNDFQQLVLTSGSTQGIQIILQTLLKKGDCVATEDPSFLFALPYFAALGIRLEGIPQDDEGMSAHAFSQACQKKKIRLLYLNPTHQNPTGRSMSLHRRKQIIAICRHYQIPIIEDDIFAELSFATVPPSLKELAPDQVIYLGSLSKIFSPLIKIGWILAPQALIQAFSETKERLDLVTDLFPQLLAYQALTDENYQETHKQLVKHLKQKDQQFQALFPTLQKDWQIRTISGGMYHWLTWKHQPLKRKDWDLFLAHNILLAPSFLFSNDTMSCRMNFTRLAKSQVTPFIKTMQLISEQLRKDDYL